MPIDYALAIYRGDTHRWQFRLWADAGKTQPADLTGVVVAAQLRDSPNGTVVQELTCTVDANTIEVLLEAPDSAQLPAAGAWDLQLTYPSTDVKTLVAGPVSVRGDVTRATLRAVS
jgi:hypothetical protein